VQDINRRRIGNSPWKTTYPCCRPAIIYNVKTKRIQNNRSSRRLTTYGAGEASRLARGQLLAALAQLLPDVTGSVRETLQQTNLAAEGLWIKIPIPGFHFPSVVKYNNIDARASMTETLSVTDVRNGHAPRGEQSSFRDDEFDAQHGR
jgi:hypothetical protein